MVKHQDRNRKKYNKYFSLPAYSINFKKYFPIIMPVLPDFLVCKNESAVE